MASNKLVVSDFDFDNVKANLKTFLQNQPEFSDYNFEGSGFAVLLDTLAYNANMFVNESYLDSADIRKNIVSLAKAIGYTPSSVRAPMAEIDILVNNASGSSILMNKGTTFTTTVDGTGYNFLTNEDITITPLNGVYKFSNVKLYEGTLVTFKYTVDSSDSDQRFMIRNIDADTSTLKVTIQNSVSDSTLNTYTLATGLRNLNNTSKIYFLQETDTGKFEVYFGDGVIGNKLEDGNIVILEYIVTNQEEANGASKFELGSSIGAFSNVTITTKSNAQGGSDEEEKESIRFNAPLQYTAQDRAVTATDYETIVRSIYPNALSVSAWGGEDDETPVYGVVKISIKAASGSTLTEATKASIVKDLIPYNVAAVRPEIIDPEITSILLTTTAKYDKKGTSKSDDTLKSEIITAITNYNSSTLQKFDGVFRFSKLTGLIDDVDTSILSNITTIKMRKNFTPTISSSTKYDIYFRNSIWDPHDSHPSVLTSTGFKVSGSNNEMFLDDDSKGNVRRYYLVSGVKTYANSTQGTINYETGQVTLNSLNVASILNIRGVVSNVIELTATPKSNDIVPVRNQVVEIDVSNSNITVEEDTFVGGSSEAGVGYTTTTSH